MQCLPRWLAARAQRHAGIEMIRGQSPPNNETGFPSHLLLMNKPKAVQIDVTPNRVGLIVGGQRIFDWHGDPSQFSMQPGWRRPDSTVLGLGSYNACFLVSRLELAPRVTVPRPRLTAGDMAIGLTNGSRFIVRPNQAQRISVTADSMIRQIPLSRLRTLTREDNDSANVLIVLEANDLPIGGELLGGLLEFKTQLGVLKLPVGQIAHASRPSTGNPTQ